MKRPSFQFYPADWRKDAALQSCSVAAQGLWINALCIAHECDPYGHLTVNGKPMTAAQIGRLVGISPKEADRLIAELEDAGVLNRTEEGAIYSRRMVRDEQSRETRAEIGRQNGIKGKDFGAMGAQHGAKGGRPKKEENPAETPPPEPGQKPPQNPRPSSSSSSSSSKDKEAELPLDFVLPDWMPTEAWDGYVAMRKKQRKPMTDRARDLKVAELQRFRDEGYDIEAILDKSTANSWTDIYAPKDGSTSPTMNGGGNRV